MIKWEGYQHGINLGGWLSQSDLSEERLKGFIVEEDIAKIAEWGLDHVRVPVDHELIENEDGTFIAEGFLFLDKIISLCEKYGLNMILDLHKTAGFSFDFRENSTDLFVREDLQERFYRLWEEFAKRYGMLSNRISFELLNEITDKDFNEKWLEISEKCIKRIRKYAPDTYILVGGYWNNSIRAIKDLAMPFDDKIVYNFHCYDPFIFTHQGAYWVKDMPADFRIGANETILKYDSESHKLSGYLYPTYEAFENKGLSKINATFFKNYFREAVQISEERKVPLYCGEYGVIDLAGGNDALLWIRAINKAFNDIGIGHAFWTYKEMDFGVVDKRYDDVRTELVKCI